MINLTRTFNYKRILIREAQPRTHLFVLLSCTPEEVSNNPSKAFSNALSIIITIKGDNKKDILKIRKLVQFFTLKYKSHATVPDLQQVMNLKQTAYFNS